MNRDRLVPALALAVAALAIGPSSAHEYRAGALEIDHPYAPAPPPGAPSVAGYLAIANGGDAPDRLLGATADFAERVELHATTIDGDVARMRRLEGGIEIPAGATVELAPGGTHLMFVGPERGLAVGDELAVTLAFERAGEVGVTFNVEDGAELSETSHEGHGGASGDGVQTDADAAEDAHDGH